MFDYQKSLQYPIRIKNPNPALAKFIISQYGGPDGELAASLRYLSQRFSMPYPELKGLLTDIGTSYAQITNALFAHVKLHICNLRTSNCSIHYTAALNTRSSLIR
jgi:spore coat protein JC